LNIHKKVLSPLSPEMLYIDDDFKTASYPYYLLYK